MHSGARSTPHAPPACDPPRFHGDPILPIGRGGPAGFRSRPSIHGAFHRSSTGHGAVGSIDLRHAAARRARSDSMGLRTVLHSPWRPSSLVKGWKPLSSLEWKRCAIGLFSVPARLDPSAGSRRAAPPWRRRLPKRLPAVRRLLAPRKANASLKRRRSGSASWGSLVPRAVATSPDPPRHPCRPA